MNQMLQYDPAKRPTASQVLNHPYFARTLKSSGSNGQQPQVWGEQSSRENYIKKKSIIQHKYENPKDKVINIQNQGGPNNMRDLDNDWDYEFDELMKPTTTYNKQGNQANRSVMKPVEEGSMANSRTYINNKSDVYMQNSNYNLKNDAKSNVKQSPLWDDQDKLEESFEAEFDVFDKKGAGKGSSSNPFAFKSNQNSYGGAKLLDEKKNESSKHAAFDVGWADEF